MDREIVKELSEILGPEGVADSSVHRITYSTDMWPKFQVYKLMSRFGEHPPDLIVWPRTEEQVRAIVEVLRRHQTPLIPAGGLSGVCGGTLPHRGGVIMDMKRMNRVLNFDTSSAVVEVESGIIGQVFEEYLNERGFTLGHFPSSIFCSTVGGYASTRSAGQYSSRYGKFEDMVIGGHFVTGAGQVIDVDVPPGDAGELNPFHLLMG